MEDEDYVEPQAPNRENSPKVKEQDAGPRTQSMGQGCYWNDKKYSDGAAVCESHIRYECWNGRWVEVGQC
jgi:hypothetical protein